jgi:hypothetical protein
MTKIKWESYGIKGIDEKKKIGTIDYILHDTPKIQPCKKLCWKCSQHLFATLSGECQRPFAYHALLLDTLL